MTTLFEKIETITPKLGDWCSVEKATTLASLVIGIRPKVIVEIGVWLGGSFLPMALALKYIGSGKIIGIDPWSAKHSIQGQEGANKDWWSKAPHEEIYQAFQANITLMQLEKFIEIKRVVSDDYNPQFGINLLSLDGNHGEQAIKDVSRYAPNIAPGGVIVVDDLHWDGKSVERAVGLLPDMGFIELYRIDNQKESWAVFQRCKQ